jgi:hypothetical protein
MPVGNAPVVEKTIGVSSARPFAAHVKTAGVPIVIVTADVGEPMNRWSPAAQISVALHAVSFVAGSGSASVHASSIASVMTLGGMIFMRPGPPVPARRDRWPAWCSCWSRACGP